MDTYSVESLVNATGNEAGEAEAEGVEPDGDSDLAEKEETMSDAVDPMLARKWGFLAKTLKVLTMIRVVEEKQSTPG